MASAAGGGLRALRRLAAPPSASSAPQHPVLRAPSTSLPSLSLPHDRQQLGAAAASALGVDSEGALLAILSGGSASGGVDLAAREAAAASAALCAPLLAAAERGDFGPALGALQQQAAATSSLPSALATARLGGAQLTLLHYAAAAAHAPLVQALLGAGAHAGARSAQPAGLTPLHSAASAACGEPQQRALTVACLAAAGGDVNATDGEFAQTPLHLAAAKGCSSVVEALLASGARAAAVDRFGDTPAALAEDAGFPQLQALLVEWEGRQAAGEGAAGRQ